MTRPAKYVELSERDASLLMSNWIDGLWLREIFPERTVNTIDRGLDVEWPNDVDTGDWIASRIRVRPAARRRARRG